MTWRRGDAELTAVARVAGGLASAPAPLAAVVAALDAVRASFGWAYGSYWRADPTDRTLRFMAGSGDLGSTFQAAADAAAQTGHRSGRGLCGLAWLTLEPVPVGRLALVPDCPRSAAAEALGIAGAVSIPVFVDEQFAGTMDFFGTGSAAATADKLDVLMVIAVLVGQALERLAAGPEVPAELIRSIREISEGARAVGEAAKQAVDRVAEAMEAVAGLGTTSAEIGSVVRVISSIAGQTNQVALHAAAEAARIGDTGGELAEDLAGVAGEVKQLAEQTYDATGEVEQRISAIRAGTAGAAAGIGAARAAVERVNQLNRRIAVVAAVVDDQEEILEAFTRRATHQRVTAHHLGASV